MSNLSMSDKYALATAIGLLFMVMFNSAVVILIISVIGLVAGLWVARHGEVRRGAYVAMAACAVALVFGVIVFLR